MCGNPAIPAILFGFPAGVICGGLLGVGLGQLLLKAALRAIDQGRTGSTSVARSKPLATADDLWDRHLDT